MQQQTKTLGLGNSVAFVSGNKAVFSTLAAARQRINRYKRESVLVAVCDNVVLLKEGYNLRQRKLVDPDVVVQLSSLTKLGMTVEQGLALVQAVERIAV